MMKRYKYIVYSLVVFLVLGIAIYFSFSKESYVVDNAKLFNVYYYPTREVNILKEVKEQEFSNKIVIKNITQDSYLYQIRVSGKINNNVYLRYKKNDEKLSNEIYLKNLGSDGIVIDSQHMKPNQEDSYIFYVYSKEENIVSNLSFSVEEVIIAESNIEDVTPPTIVLAGENEITVNQGDDFVDPGIESIVDNYDESISKGKVNLSYQVNVDGELKTVDKIDTSVVGTYYIYYRVSDMAKNETTVIRIVHVVRQDEEGVSSEEDEVEDDTSSEEIKEEINEENKEENVVPFEVNVNYSTQSMTTNPVLVTITANEEMIAISGWELSKDGLRMMKKYASNAIEEILIISKKGSSSIVKISIQNIDKSGLNTDGEVEDTDNKEVLIKLNAIEYGTSYINLEYTVTNEKDIKEYSYTCDGSNWVKTTSKQIVCDKLLQNTTYNVQVKALSNKGDEIVSNIVEKKTMSLSSPVISVENEMEWSKTKEVVISYQSKMNMVKYFYKVDSDWIEVAGDIKIEVLRNQTIYAKVTDGTNTVEVSRDVDKIDVDGPVITNRALSNTLLRSNKIKINWNKAVDVSTSESDLVYYVCKNKEEVECINNPDARLNNIDTYTFSSLNANTSYKLQVIVFDKLGNYSVYDSIEIKTKELYDISNKKDLVGIMYSTWFNPIYSTPYNITNILAGTESWGPVNAFHYWAKPALGYYRSDDKSIIRTHMEQLKAAGVDFIIIDNTNANLDTWGYGEGSYWYDMVTLPLKALTEVVREMKDEGLETPYLVNWIGTGNGLSSVNQIITDFYNNEDNKDIFVYWNKLPFIITTTKVTNPPSSIYTRHMWGLQPTLATEEWSYLQVNNNKPSYASNGTVEQIGVSVAMQRDYMSNTALAVGRNHGITFYNQWVNAFRYHPKVVTVTWWNEWAAQRLYVNGNYVFTDNYNQEYSRDIEPMEGGHGEQYYKWLKQYISAYKSYASCPRLVESGY